MAEAASHIEETHKISDRVTQLEAEVGSIARQLPTLVESVQDLNNSFNHLAIAVQKERLEDKHELSERLRIPWGVLLSFAVGLIAFGSAVIAPLSFQQGVMGQHIDANQNGIARLESRLSTSESLLLEVSAQQDVVQSVLTEIHALSNRNAERVNQAVNRAHENADDLDDLRAWLRERD